MEWIKAIDNYPPIGTPVLICFTDKSILVGYRSEEEETENVWIIISDTEIEYGNKITHWMPLPSPPKQKDNA